MKKFSLFWYLEKHPKIKWVYSIVLLPLIITTALLFAVKSIIFGIVKQVFVHMPQEVKEEFGDVTDFYINCVFGRRKMSSIEDDEMTDMHEYY